MIAQWSVAAGREDVERGVGREPALRDEAIVDVVGRRWIVAPVERLRGLPAVWFATQVVVAARQAEGVERVEYGPEIGAGGARC